MNKVNLRSLLNAEKDGSSLSGKLCQARKALKINVTGKSVLPDTRSLSDYLPAGLIDENTWLPIEKRPEFLLVRLGAKYIVSNSSIGTAISDLDMNAKWDNETIPDIDALKFNSLSPHRMLAFISMPAQFYSATKEGLDEVIIAEAYSAMIAKLQSAILSDAEETSNTPAGILTTAEEKEITAQNITDLKVSVMEAGTMGRNVAFLTNAKGAQKIDLSDVSAKFDQNKLFRLPFYETPAINNSGTNSPLVCADFSQLAIVQFGDITIEPNPYSEITKGIVSFKVTGFFDWTFRGKAISSVLI